jgi:hypothetical protein
MFTGKKSRLARRTLYRLIFANGLSTWSGTRCLRDRARRSFRGRVQRYSLELAG